MKKLLFNLVIFLSPIVCFADGHLTEAQKKKTIECAGIYYANSMIPQAELELDKIVHSFAAKKFLKVADHSFTAPSFKPLTNSRDIKMKAMSKGRIEIT